VREKILDYMQLWRDLVEEDIQRNTSDVTSSKEVEVDFTLVRKGKKSKEKKSQGEGGGNKMDLLKVMFFPHDEYRNYARISHKRKQARRSLQ